MRKYHVSAGTVVGNMRKKNEDNFFCNGKYKDMGEEQFFYSGNLNAGDKSVIGVFDGMGGLKNGMKASFIAAKILEKYVNSMREVESSFQSKFILKKINDYICQEIESSGEKMGSTAVLWICESGKAHISNLGDSRAYLYREKTLKQISVDHTEENSIKELQRKLGLEEPIEIFGDRHVLTQHLGITESEFILEPADSEYITILEGDIFVLCSDGLTEMLSDTDISEILDESSSVAQKRDKLIEAALDAGGKDNITIVLIES